MEPLSPTFAHDAEATRSLHSLIDELARQTTDAWRLQGYAESAFGDIACEVLAGIDLVGALHWPALQEHVFTPISPEPMQSVHPAPEIIPLYNGRHFKIYAHLWLDKIAEAHHHSWTGAFQVLEGRSLNGAYKFTPTETIREGLSLGRLELTKCQIHAPGAIVAVNPGPKFIHGLHYLERPGLAISLRGGRLMGNTCTYYRPGVAVQSDLKDPGITSILRVLQILYHTDRKAFAQRLLELIPRCDLMTVHLILFQAVRTGWTLPPTLLETGREAFGDRFAAIEGAAGELATLDKIVQLRGRFTDPGVRYFLAALSFGEDRRTVWDLVKQYAPDQDPQDCIGHWLIALLVDTEGNPIPDSMARGLGRLALGASIEEVRADLAGEGTLAGELDEQLSVLAAVHTAMAEAPIYKPLFQGDAIPG